MTTPPPPCGGPPPRSGEEFAAAAARLAGAACWALHWTPDEFWRATPGELAAILAAASGGDGAGAGAVTRARIETLQERYPDG